MRFIGVSYDKRGDVVENSVRVTEEELNKLKNHECVFALIDIPTGEVLVDKSEGQALSYLSVDTLKPIDVRDILELFWINTEDLHKYE